MAWIIALPEDRENGWYRGVADRTSTCEAAAEADPTAAELSYAAGRSTSVMAPAAPDGRIRSVAT
jgi:hypothetical protein